MVYSLTEVKRVLESENEMKEWGASIGTLLKGGEYIELIGDVGAGKTTFAKGLAAGMGITETVQSPTFTINRVYDASAERRLSHYDFYRLRDPGIMAEELRETTTDPKTVTIIEWGEIVADVRPDDYLQLEFRSLSETTREVSVMAHGNKSEQVLKEIKS